MTLCNDDTIAAISTPPGPGGIGIVRLSGPRARGISREITGRDLVSRRFTHAWVENRATGERVDEVMAVYLAAPRTYTRQDMVEIHGHGGPACMSRILDLCLEHGARLALPGEFTRRAFMAGRIDLAQAEAVADLVQAHADGSRRVALAQLEGGLSRRVTGMEEEILSVLAGIEGALDFPEHEEMEADAVARAREQLLEVRDELVGLLDGSRRGRVLRDGMRVVIAGRPNAGKSSLLNALLDQDRALVSSLPGTTRDTIEETMDVDGIPVVLVDTAGLRDDGDEIEQMGVERTRSWLERADMVLLVIDGAQPLAAEDRALARQLLDRPYLVVLNKSDLDREVGPGDWEPGGTAVAVSALLGKGLGAVREAIRECALSGGVPGDTPLVSSARHREALRRALGALDSFASLSGPGVPELLAVDLRDCLDALGEISGRDASLELLDRVFARFCIGK